MGHEGQCDTVSTGFTTEIITSALRTRSRTPACEEQSKNGSSHKKIYRKRWTEEQNTGNKKGHRAATGPGEASKSPPVTSRTYSNLYPHPAQLTSVSTLAPADCNAHGRSCRCELSPGQAGRRDSGRTGGSRSRATLQALLLATSFPGLILTLPMQKGVENLDIVFIGKISEDL